VRPDLQTAEDARTIRGILSLLREEPEPIITVQLVAMTQAVSQDTARRLLRNLAKAGVIEHPTREADVLGIKQKVPCIGWVLTEKGKRGEIQSAELLAGGMA
jgi:DNA-binding Lrp family transcriptional regulator